MSNTPSRKTWWRRALYIRVAASLRLALSNKEFTQNASVAQLVRALDS